jgi:hypothetical protein
MSTTLALYGLLGTMLAVPAQGAPPNSPPAPRGTLRVEAEVFASFDHTSTENSELSTFEARRAELGTRWLAGGSHWGGELRVEGVRSAGTESLNGIDGNSMVLRMKRAWAFGRLAPFESLGLELRAGLVPDPWIETLEADYDLRALSATSGEAAELVSPADAGASVRVDALDRRVRLSVTVSNGEGYRETELNTGKDTTLVLSVEPLRFSLFGSPARVGVHLGWRDGSTGAARLPAGRLLAGLAFVSARLSGGAEYLYADGAHGREVHADALGVWTEGVVLPGWLGLAARFDRHQADVDLDDSFRERWTMGVVSSPFGRGSRRDDRLRTWVVAQLESIGQAAPPLPGAATLGEVTRVMFMLELLASAEIDR